MISSDGWMPPLLPALPRAAHKGTSGRVVCVCGSRDMPGAALLSVRAAQRSGAGLVTLAAHAKEALHALAPFAPEAIGFDLARAHGESNDESIGSALTRALRERAPHAVVIGCGLGQDDVTRALVLAATAFDGPLVLDADALNVLGTDLSVLRARRAPTVMTPHPGEASRLLGREVGSAHAERLAAADALARASSAIVVLKGASTIVTDGSRTYVESAGNPGMATAGTGDVLAGILGAYLARTRSAPHPTWGAFAATARAVRVHALAGDAAAARLGETGLIASDVIDALPAAHLRE